MRSIFYLLPHSVKQILRNFRTVLYRLLNWIKIATRLKGNSFIDAIKFYSSFCAIPITIWRNLDSFQFPSTFYDLVVVSRQRGVFTIRKNSDDLFHALPWQEPAVEDAINSCVGKGDIFIDAGANIGYYSVLASRLVGSLGKVFACEMMPSTISVLRNNIKLNKCNNIIVVEAAISSRNDMLIDAHMPSQKFGSASIVRHKFMQGIQVKTVTLSNILKNYQEVACIKLDLEGAELEALIGMGNDLQKFRYIIFENNQESDLASFLTRSGYSIKYLDPRNALAIRNEINF